MSVGDLKTDQTLLPNEVLNILNEGIQRHELEQSRAEADKSELIQVISDIASEFAIKVERIGTPLCICDGDGHVVSQVIFNIDTLEEEIRAWLFNKPRVMRLYQAHRSGNQGDLSGKRVAYRICERFVKGKADAITMLARQTLIRPEGDNTA